MNQDENLKRLKRDARRSDKFPAGSACAECGIQDPILLVENTDALLCYEHHEMSKGKSGFEADHFAGKANSKMTLLVPANMNRLNLDNQHGWPRDTLRNPEGNPLLKAEAIVRGWVSYLSIILSVVEKVPD